MAAAAATAGGPGGGRKPGSPRDSEAELWSRRVRELVSAGPANRLCFECGQRGVTYVDITLGSFVCTGCSGALRGLNPPHRVKSISMTTFTEAEVLFLQSRGNEACRKVWLGTFDPRTSLLPDSRDPQKVKDFLQDKYEKKRWYLLPDQAKAVPPPTSQSCLPEAKPAPSLLGDSGTLLPDAGVSQPPPSQHWTPQTTKKPSTDLLADIGGDPFAAPQPSPAFAAFPAFGIGGVSPSAFGTSPPSQPAQIPDLSGAPGSIFQPLSQPSPAPAYGAFTNPFASPPPARPSTNPFQANGLTPGVAFSVGSPSGFVTPQASPAPGAFPTPFQASIFSQPVPLGPQPNGSSFGFGATKVGQPVSVSTNPFLTTAPATTHFVVKHPATNPFL
ncbi:arf-GAP domain and FG repeat-containing protein 2 isoform B [Alligator mississippiensis]|uniref:Arf-GAP domain and FG repeat-containing protein 2 isoform B n=1 Tax=Alligator mississippiensis TaxID=8496 RepID=A0A151PJ90_ALLMI|nr:arf-GAP domain and FG repeat-containing protein 2 isoform B [Alligator mississippiensis]